MAIAIHAKSNAHASWIEHQMLDHIKNALRVTINWQAPSVTAGTKLSSVRFAMQSFQRHLERVMRIEEQGNYLYHLAERRPGLRHKIDRLAAEHDLLRQELAKLVPELAALEPWQIDELDEVCGQIRQLLTAVDAHDACEVDLLQEAMLYDVGGEG